MASPATDTWWSSFLDAEGRDSEEDRAFTGYLTTQGIPAGSAPDVLQDAYTKFREFMQESEDREADRGPDRATLAKEQAVIALEQQFVAKSWVSAPGVEKPKTAVTRPKETREPLSGGGVGPEGEAQVAPATGVPEASQTPTSVSESSEESSPESRSRYGRRGSSEA